MGGNGDRLCACWIGGVCHLPRSFPPSISPLLRSTSRVDTRLAARSIGFLVTNFFHVKYRPLCLSEARFSFLSIFLRNYSIFGRCKFQERMEGEVDFMKKRKKKRLNSQRNVGKLYSLFTWHSKGYEGISFVKIIRHQTKFQISTFLILRGCVRKKRRFLFYHFTLKCKCLLFFHEILFFEGNYLQRQEITDIKSIYVRNTELRG